MSLNELSLLMTKYQPSGQYAFHFHSQSFDKRKGRHSRRPQLQFRCVRRPEIGSSGWTRAKPRAQRTATPEDSVGSQRLSAAKGLAPQAGLEPATLRLTAGTSRLLRFGSTSY